VSDVRDDVQWSPVYEPAWDETPAAYVEHGAVAWGRSRRLGKYGEDAHGLKAYIGVQHFDPAHWHTPGEPVARFFVSLFLHGRTLALHTYPTMDAALTAVRAPPADTGSS
jgi:hypothetical protein